MKIKLFLISASFLVLTLFSFEKCLSQRVKSTHYTINFVHHSKYDFSKNYKSFKVNYDVGGFMVKKQRIPILGKLSSIPDFSDLVINIVAKNATVQSKSLVKEGSDKSWSYSYKVYFLADYGFSIIDWKTNTELVSMMNESGSEYSPSFNNVNSLDQYMENNFISKEIDALLFKSWNSIAYLFNDNIIPIAISINTVKGDAKEYVEINRATDAFIKTISDTTISADTVKASLETWETYLAMANFKDEYSVINEKVADGLISNLCAGYLIMENYSRIKELAAGYKSRHNGLFEGFGPHFAIFEGSVYQGPKRGWEKTFSYKNQWHSDVSFGQMSENELKINESLEKLTQH